MNRIRRLRQEKGLSIDQLSSELKKKGFSISPASISKYEREKRNPKIESWVALAEYFNVPVPYLQGISEVKDWKENTRKINLDLKNANESHDDNKIRKAYQNIRDSIVEELSDNTEELKVYFHILNYLLEREPLGNELKDLSDKIDPKYYSLFASQLANLLKIYLYAIGKHDKKALSTINKITKLMIDFEKGID